MLKPQRKRFECNALPKGWTREEVTRRSGLMSGKVDVFYYSPKGKKIRSKSQLVRSLSDVVDLSTFDYMTGKVNSVLLRRNRKKAQSEGTRGLRNDTSLTSPIRQTASIFKQPVTIIKSQESKVRQELKHGRQEKPRQLFWEKRLENLDVFQSNEETSEKNHLPLNMKPVGPNVKPDTALQVCKTPINSHKLARIC